MGKSTVPDFVDVIGQDGLDADSIDTFQSFVSDYAASHAEIKTWETKKDEAKGAIKSMIEAFPVLAKVRLSHFTVSAFPVSRESIDKALLKNALLERRIPIEDIKAILVECTKTSTSDQLRITPNKKN